MDMDWTLGFSRGAQPVSCDSWMFNVFLRNVCCLRKAGADGPVLATGLEAGG